MKEINPTEAKSLRDAKQTGWYAVWANPPQLHPDHRYVVQLGDRFFLTEDPKEFRIELSAVFVLNGLLKQGHLVYASGPIAELLQAETQKAKSIDIGAGVPTYHTKGLEPKR